jgi:hypothetical protein
MNRIAWSGLKISPTERNPAASQFVVSDAAHAAATWNTSSENMVGKIFIPRFE